MKQGLMVLFFITALTSLAAASDGDIPIAFIKLQIINFVVFVGLVFFLSRSKLAPLLKQIKIDYLHKSQEAQKKLDDARNKRDDLVRTIEKLEEDFSAILKRANEQAETQYKTKLLSVKSSVQALDKDLEAQMESLKRSQIVQLKTLLMEESIQGLKTDLSFEVDEKLLLKLQNNFVESVSV